MFRSPGPIALAFRLPADLPLVGGLSVSIRWYGVLIASSMALGLWLSAREAARRGESPDDLLKAAEIALIGGLIGARLYYVLFNLDYYQTQPWWRIFAVWEGGLAIHGGLIAGLLDGRRLRLGQRAPPPDVPGHRGAVASRWRRPSAAGGTSSTRRRSEGRPTCPWKLFISEPRRPPAFVDQQFFHPTFLYESLWNVGAFLVLYFVLRRRLERAPGALFLAYLGLYSLGRFWIEGLRTDSLMLGSFRVAQIVSVAAVVVAVVGIPILLRRRRT